MADDPAQQLGVDDDFEPVPGSEDLPSDVRNGDIEDPAPAGPGKQEDQDG